MIDPAQMPVEEPDDGRDKAKHWLKQIDNIKGNRDWQRWFKRAETIEKRYRDERQQTGDGHRRCNSLWSNIEILRPALFGKAPLPVAERRFRDKDPVGRAAAQILERALRSAVEDAELDCALGQAVTDYLLPGRGTVWVRYVPEFEEAKSLPPDNQIDDDTETDDGLTIEGEAEEIETIPGEAQLQLFEAQLPFQDDGELDKLQQTGERLVREAIEVDYVPWTDFFTFPARARVWKEVTAIGKRVYMTRDQMKKRFKDKGARVPLRKEDHGLHQRQSDGMTDDDEKGEVFEIWNKDDRTVYWVASGFDELLDRQYDPFELTRFFPAPKPLIANATNSTLIPVPDYIQYQDQALQIDELTHRIYLLTNALKVAGVYNAAAPSIQRLLNESVENELIPVDEWAAFAEKGGVEGNISLLPIKEIMGVLNELIIAKAKQVEEMDRLTGITDIMRGTTDARETLGGQRLKSNSSGTRLTARQNEVARFARDTVQIMAELMSSHFSPQTLINMSGALYQEGLGPDDMPSLSSLQGIAPQPPVQPQGAPVPAPPMAQPPAPAPMGGPALGGAPLPAPIPGGMPPPPPIPPEIQAKIEAISRIQSALALIRDEKMLGFRVDIEVDSTIYGDAAQEKQDRTEFLTSVTVFLEKSMQMGSMSPEMIPLLGKMLQFGVRGHRVGRDLEVAIEEFCDDAIIGAKQRLAQAQGQPSPEQMKVQLEMQRLKNDILVQQEQNKVELAKAAAQQRALEVKTQADVAKSQAEIARQEIENQGEQANANLQLQEQQMQMEMKRVELEMKQIDMQIELAKLQQARHAALNPPVSKANDNIRNAERPVS